MYDELAALCQFHITHHLQMLDKLRKLLERNDHKLKASQDQIRELVSKIKQESEEKIRLRKTLHKLPSFALALINCRKRIG